jgi:hypothetical protein
MRYRSLLRAFMIVVGITATIVIVLSQALPEISESVNEKAKTEQTEKTPDQKVISAPSDVVPGGITQVNDADRSLLETFIYEKCEVIEFNCDPDIFSNFFNILFRAIISPNAP